MDIKTFKSVLPFLKEAGIVPCVIGDAGIGKSSIVKQFAEENGYSFHPYFLSQMSDSGDILGLPEFNRDENGKALSTSFIHPAKLPKKPRSLLFFDELNRTTKDLLQAIFQLVLEGEYHDYKLPPESFIVVAMNPSTDDYSVLDFSDKAFNDRFLHILLKPTVEEFVQYGIKKYGDDDYLDFINNQPEFLETSGSDFNLDFVKPTRRSSEKFIKLKRTNVDRKALTELSLGLIGTATTIAYSSYLENKKKIPTGKDILNNFSNELIEDYVNKESPRTDAISSMCNSCISYLMQEENKLTQETVDNLLKFLLAIPVENLYSCLLDITKNNRFIANQDLFEKVIGQNTELADRIKEARNLQKQAK